MMKRLAKRGKQAEYLIPSDKEKSSIELEEDNEIRRILSAKDFYEVLEFKANDDLDEMEAELRESYLEKCQALNPSENNHPSLSEASERLIEAYDTLSDPGKRRDYDIKMGYVRDEVTDITFGDIMGLLFGLHPTPGGGRSGQTRQLLQRRPVATRRQGNEPGLEGVRVLLGPPANMPNIVPNLRQEEHGDQEHRDNDDEEEDVEAGREEMDRLLLNEMFGGLFGRAQREEQQEERAVPAGLGGLFRPRALNEEEVGQRYAQQLQQLEGMGFTNRADNIRALHRAGGDVNVAIEILLS